MYSVYQHWDPLKTCVVGKSYPPEFYAWIKNPKTRSIFERIAIETEEDYQSLIKILEKFNVEVLRPGIPKDSSLLLDVSENKYVIPPMTPRDYTGMFGNLFSTRTDQTINTLYNKIKDDSWPSDIHTIGDLKNLPTHIFNEISTIHEPYLGNIIDKLPNDYTRTRFGFYDNVLEHIKDKCNISESNSLDVLNTATVTRIGKDLYMHEETKQAYGDMLHGYRINTIDIEGHTDGVFCPVVPGLIVSLYNVSTYKDTFPGWEVIGCPDQSWEKIQPFLDLKKKNKGKWWIPGEEYNDDVIETVDKWMSKWVGYVEETVFDVNMLVIDEKNVIVNNYNKQVFNALERYGVTPHICNFRHRYFWDGGLHCITSDVDREGEMKDYFPERE